MDERVMQMTEMLVEQSREQAGILAKEMETDGQLSLPQQLAAVQYTNDDGEEFYLVIGLDLSRTAIGRRLEVTDLLFYVFHDEKFVVSMYCLEHPFDRFDSNVGTDVFRQETKRMVDEAVMDDCKAVERRIEEDGISTADPFMVPEKVQHRLLWLTDRCTLSVLGHTFDGVDGLKDYVREQTEHSRPYVLDRCELFPCFDAEDYANEYRFYRNYLICHNKQEADAKVKQMERLPSSGNFCLVDNGLADEMRPMVYYMDESMKMLLAY